MAVSLATASCDGGATLSDSTKTRPVDLVYLARYTMGNKSLEREVLELFLTQSVQYLARLSQAGDAKSWREAAHTIKGSARGIGAWRIACCAEEAELLSGAAWKKRRRGTLDELEVTIRETNGFIRSLLADA